jgi:hypothetical protein
MSTLNRYVLNCAYPEGSMIEAYTTEEAIRYCTKYIQDGNVIGLPIPLHEGRILRMGCTGRKVHIDVEDEMVQEAHQNALNQLVVMDKWVEKHLEEFHCARDRRMEAWV